MSADNGCPIVFLDIDGVLHSFDYEQYLTNHNMEWFDKDGAIFAPDCINAFRELINITNAKIVISSSWKDSRICRDALSILRDIWERRNLPGEIIDVTPTLTPDELQFLYGIRTTRKWKGYEIDLWLKHNPQCQSYIIIDDQDVVLDYQKAFFIMTNGNKGLQNKDVKKAVEILCQLKQEKYIRLRRLFSSILHFIGNFIRK